jgi:hypothetical protein
MPCAVGVHFPFRTRTVPREKWELGINSVYSYVKVHLSPYDGFWYIDDIQIRD